MRGEREQPPDRTSLLIISFHIAEPPLRVCQTIRASPFSPPPPNGLSLRVVSRSPPIPLSVHTFLFRLLFSLSRCFSWQKTHLRRERKSAPRREPMGKVSTTETRGRTFDNNDFATLWIFIILISPVSIISSRRIFTTIYLWFFSSAIFLRSATERANVASNKGEGDFSLSRGYEVPQPEYIFAGHIFFAPSLFLSLPPLFFLLLSFTA